MDSSATHSQWNWLRWLAWPLWALALAGLVYLAGLTAWLGITGLFFPYQLDYGEGTHLHYVKEWAMGRPIYRPIGSYPYITSNYAPGGEENPGGDRFRQLAIVLDGTLYSAPVIREAIYGGKAEISGSFTVEEATFLANILKAGRLPVPLKIVEKRFVDPGLGRDSIRHIWLQHPTILELRRLLEDTDNYPGICGECKLARHCRTGCVAQNYVNGGRLVGPDELCEVASRRGIFQASRLKSRPKGNPAAGNRL